MLFVRMDSAFIMSLDLKGVPEDQLALLRELSLRYLNFSINHCSTASIAALKHFLRDALQRLKDFQDAATPMLDAVKASVKLAEELDAQIEKVRSQSFVALGAGQPAQVVKAVRKLDLLWSNLVDRPLSQAEDRAQRFIEQAHRIQIEMQNALDFGGSDDDEDDVPAKPQDLQYGALLLIIQAATGSDDGELPEHMRGEALILKDYELINNLVQEGQRSKRQRSDPAVKKEEPAEKKHRAQELAFQVDDGELQVGGVVFIGGQPFSVKTGPAMAVSLQRGTRVITFPEFGIAYKVRLDGEAFSVRAVADCL